MALESTHRVNVDSYLALLRTLATDRDERAARILVGQFGKKERYRRLAWAIARQAHIVEIPATVWEKIDHTADVYLAESVAGGKWQPLAPELAAMSPALALTHGLMEQESIYRMAHEAAQNLGVPGPRPFDVLFLAFGRGLPLLSRLILVRRLLPEALQPLLVQVRVTGILVSDDLVLEVQRAEFRPGYEIPDAYDTTVLAIYEDEIGWWLPELCHPWSLAWLMDAINAQDTLIRDTELVDKRRFSSRYDWQKLVKSHGLKPLLPPPYYAVDIRPTTIEAALKPAKRRHVSWTHRWPVRGHRVTHVDGGPLPLDPKKERRLRRRLYEIYPHGQALSAEVLAILMRHRMPPPPPGCWVAIRIGWREAFVKGPPDKPFVPSTLRVDPGIVDPLTEKLPG